MNEIHVSPLVMETQEGAAGDLPRIPPAYEAERIRERIKEGSARFGTATIENGFGVTRAAGVGS